MIESALAAHRLTRLVVADRITRHPRRQWIERAYLRDDPLTAHRGDPDDDHPMTMAIHQGRWEDVVKLDPDPPLAATWASCSWCAGMWTAAAVVVLDQLDPPGWATVRRALAVADLVGLISGHEEAF